MNFFKNKRNIISLILLLFFVSCSREKPTNEVYNVTPGGDIANSPQKDAEIQRYNLSIKKEESVNRLPCDTLSLMEYVLNNYPEGSYVVYFDKTFTYNIPKPAVIYYGDDYIFTVIAESKPHERLIEVKNIVGYDQSFINLDSTKLGTATFYLTLFKCNNGDFEKIWESIIPSNGGFNYFQTKKWNYDGTPYIKVDFYYAQGIGHIDYNYFFINGIENPPQLLMTNKGINFERTLANVNNDKYPDYYQHIFFDLGNRIISRDSIAFIWDKKRELYTNVRNKRQTSPY